MSVPEVLRDLLCIHNQNTEHASAPVVDGRGIGQRAGALWGYEDPAAVTGALVRSSAAGQ